MDTVAAWVSTLGAHEGREVVRRTRPTACSTGRTGLIWQSIANTASSWFSALSTCEAMTLDRATDWRLPNIKELLSVVDDTHANLSTTQRYMHLSPAAKSEAIGMLEKGAACGAEMNERSIAALSKLRNQLSALTPFEEQTESSDQQNLT
ncbi:MAG: DUF1566 domain-containing protein [Archangium sp.]|nr:DUF1566 domain-containing protein [Archangium sp.]